MSFKVWLLNFFQLRGYNKKRWWEQNNKENFTSIDVESIGYKNTFVGKGTYGSIKVLNDKNDRRLTIGNYCSIADNVTFMLALEHETKRVSTYPFKQMLKLENDEYRDATSKGDIVVDDDVWIGYGATILSGVHIGQGAVVAAGAVVSKDVPPYAIVGGIPAKVIKYRASDEVIEYLMSLDYQKLSVNLIKEHIEELYRSIDNMSLNDVKDIFGWFPKK